MARGVRASFRVSGFKELARNLRALPDSLSQRVVTDALMDAAEPMADTARSLAPDAPPYGEGLSALIIVTDKVMPDQGEVPPGPQEAVVYVGADAERPDAAGHASLVEFGSGPRYHESGKYVGEMPAQPFLRPAFDMHKRQALDTLTRRLRQYIEAAARRLGK